MKSFIKRGLPVLLYALSGISTGVPVVYLYLWSVWGAPTSFVEFLSISGSLALIIAAVLTIKKPILAARVAFFGSLAVWSFYLPAIVKQVQITLNARRITVRVLKWSPTAAPLTIVDSGENSSATHLSDEEIEKIRNLGITGKLENCSLQHWGAGRRSQSVLIISQPPKRTVELPEPDEGTIIYLQRGDEWEKYPPNARTLKRTIRVEPYSATETVVTAELSDGSRQGSAACLWSTPRSAGVR